MDNQQYYGYPQQGYGQQYGQQYQQQPRQQQRRPPWLCVPVSCREEAVAVQMDYLYSGIIMPDVTHNAVYAKIVDPKTMETRFCDFAAVPPPKMVTADEFVTRDDFRKLCEIVQQMQNGTQTAPVAKEQEEE